MQAEDLAQPAWEMSDEWHLCGVGWAEGWDEQTKSVRNRESQPDSQRLILLNCGFLKCSSTPFRSGDEWR